MRRNEPERATLLGNLAMLYCHGAAVDWNRLAPDGAVTTLPPRTWQHRRFWRNTAPGGGGGGGQHDVDSHSGLGWRVTVSGATPLEVWRTYLDHDPAGRIPVHVVLTGPDAAETAETADTESTRSTAWGS